jgi:uncharacterized protein YegL
MQDVPNPFGQVPFGPPDLPNFQPRCPCLLLLDTSSSMRGKPIDELNAGVRVLYDSMVGDVVARDRIELAIVTFGRGGVQTVQTFTNPKPDQCPTLEVDGYTPMAQAIQTGLDLLGARMRALKLEGIKVYKPWVVLITDGGPTDEKDAITAAFSRIQSEQENGRFVFWAFGVQGADMRMLNTLGGPRALMLEGVNFRALFTWISSSLSSVSQSQPGGAIQLTPPPAFLITV